MSFADSKKFSQSATNFVYRRRLFVSVHLRLRFGLRRCCAAFQRGGNASLLKKCNGGNLDRESGRSASCLIKAFAATNLIASCFSEAAELIRPVKRWRSGKISCSAAVSLFAERGFTRVRGGRHRSPIKKPHFKT
jgi:hypothetical protein